MKRKRIKVTPELRERFERNQRRLAERIAYHRRKLAEEQAGATGDSS